LSILNLVDAATMAGPQGFVAGAARLVENTKLVEVSLSTLDGNSFKIWIVLEVKPSRRSKL